MDKIVLIAFVIIILVLGASLFYNNLSQNKNSQTAPPITQSKASQPQQTQPQTQTQVNLFNENKPAPEFTGITKWLNPEKPLTMQSLRGKVVLVDFWTNQCINCIRTLPYVTKWYDTYRDQGFVVIGVHTPELQSEYTIASIQEAIQTYNIHYPIAQDNNYATWNAYKNQYWPGFYLVDAKGIIRRTHFGEGEYNETEQAIKTLIKEARM